MICFLEETNFLFLFVFFLRECFVSCLEYISPKSLLILRTEIIGMQLFMNVLFKKNPHTHTPKPAHSTAFSECQSVIFMHEMHPTRNAAQSINYLQKERWNSGLLRLNGIEKEDEMESSSGSSLISFRMFLEESDWLIGSLTK